MPIGAILALGEAGYKLYQSEQQKNQAANLLKTKRPKQVVSQATTDSYNATRMNYGSNSTAQEQAALNGIDASTAQTNTALTQAATDSPSLLAALTASQKSMNNAKVQIGDAAVRTHQQDLNTMIATGQNYANESNAAFDFNKKQPYQDAMLAASSLTKASLENQYSAIDDIAKVGISEDAGNRGLGTTTHKTGTPTTSADALISTDNVALRQQLQAQNPNATPEYINYLMGQKLSKRGMAE